MHTFVLATFLALRALCYCDSNIPAMDKIFHLSHRTTLAIERLCDFLNNADLFGTYYGTSDCLEFEETEVFGTAVYSTTSEGNGEYASEDDDNEPTSLGPKILFVWEHRKVKLYHDYAITGWVLSVMLEVRADVEDNLTVDHRGTIEPVLSKLHKPPCPRKSKKIQVKKWVKSYTYSGWSSRISRRR